MAIPADITGAARPSTTRSRCRLPLALIAGTALVAVAALVAPPVAEPARLGGDCTPGSDWGTPRDDLARQVVQLVNAHRTLLGLGPLSVSPTLTASAVWKARHMARFRYMSHSDPAPPAARSAGDRIRACGYAASWGENVAYGYPSASSVVAAWLRSPGHRANIENRSFTATGVGAAAGAGGTLFWAQNFGAAADAPAKAAATPVRAAGATRLKAGRPKTMPARPRAGARLVVRTAVRAPDGGAIAAARVRCRAKVGGRTLTVVRRTFSRSAARCVWKVPPSARGRTVHGRIQVHAGGAATTVSFARRVG